MLLTVEGGGFFSSSASGYSKGLALLFLGQQNEENRLRISPWSRYKLIGQEAYLELQLASRKNRVSRRCTSFVCFRRTSAGLEPPSPPKLASIQQEDVCSEPPPVSYEGENYTTDHGGVKNGRNLYLKSSLRKPTDCAPIASGEDGLRGELGENRNGIPGCTEGKKVHWTDACGKELAEIREFEVR
ncbi:hypothetical protein BVC80_509g13 [Macleaya cordata]|uniref:Uncharacterized protein n=1 Tax=Macleaya cordata TaxID=56857 RepID=A0A200PT88_MACCD|nr:hypothetical protein BVC80_509g13 [Macleaya cordata]